MKKDIINLVNSSEGTLRLNNISSLHRWTKDALGDDVDRLSIEFDNINNVNFSIVDREIKARDYAGIIAECCEKTQVFLQAVSETLCKNLSAGYRNKQ